VTGWPAVVTALSTLTIAVAVLALILAMVVVLRRVSALSSSMTRVVDALERDARPALESVRHTAEEANRLGVAIRTEVEGFAGTSQRLRGRVERASRALEDRFNDLATLLDVLQDELEDTVLDLAAVMRTTRRGTGLFRAARRVILGRKR
jgi:uncharacterized protein YoxC